MKNHGPAIYFDTSSKGKNKRHNRWRADVTIRGVRYRRRGKNREDLVRFLRGITNASHGLSGQLKEKGRY
jgi:hypothetical protein